MLMKLRSIGKQYQVNKNLRSFGVKIAHPDHHSWCNDISRQKESIDAIMAKTIISQKARRKPVLTLSMILRKWTLTMQLCMCSLLSELWMRTDIFLDLGKPQSNQWTIKMGGQSMDNQINGGGVEGNNL